jgi:hypothetical protein
MNRHSWLTVIGTPIAGYGWDQKRPLPYLRRTGRRCESKGHECGDEVEEPLYLQANCQALPGSEETGEESACRLHCSEKGKVGAQDPPSRSWLAVASENGHEACREGHSGDADDDEESNVDREASGQDGQVPDGQGQSAEQDERAGNEPSGRYAAPRETARRPDLGTTSIGVFLVECVRSTMRRGVEQFGSSLGS